MLFNILLLVGTTVFLEGLAWFTHKYIMHGPMWSWHKSHHSVNHGIFEKNDLFALLFSIPAIATIIIGARFPEWNFLLYVGGGILLYGILYFIFHDVIVHHRVKIKFKPTNSYLKRIMRAHYIHHRTHTRDGAEAFGFLYASNKYEPKKKK